MGLQNIPFLTQKIVPPKSALSKDRFFGESSPRTLPDSAPGSDTHGLGE